MAAGRWWINIGHSVVSAAAADDDTDDADNVDEADSEMDMINNYSI